MKGAVSSQGEPYVGPRPFEAHDRHLFFGREREAHEIVSLVLANKLFMLYAASGAGKTSLVNAGILPLVEGELEILPTARFQERLPIRSKDVSNVYTYEVLSRWASPQDLDQHAHTSLAEFLANSPRLIQPFGLPMPRLLVFDQFEELFTTHPDRWPDRQVFLEQLAEVCDSQPDLRVLIVLREDFLSRLLSFADTMFSGLKDRYYLEPLRRPEAELAISGPVRSIGYSFESDAVSDLVGRLMVSRLDIGESGTVEVKGEFVEPVLLQVVCQTLWNVLPAGTSTISLTDVRELADVDTSLADFYSITVRRAAEHDLATEERIREWVQDNLITAGGTRAAVYMGAELTEGLPNEVVSELEGKLLRAEFRAGARWLEITHDSLLRPIEQSNRDFFRADYLRTVDTALTAESDNLAVAVNKQWLYAAIERSLTAPEPIPVRWREIPEPFNGSHPVAAEPHRFSPLPGMARTTAGKVQTGALQDLHTLYAGQGSGRLIIVGAPGSGKTSAGIILLLTALRYRERLAAKDRLRAPVPVMFSLNGWDPQRQPILEWLIGRLKQTYPLFAGRGGAERAAKLIDAGLIAVILDGLDEIPAELRPVALLSLSQQASLRVVVLSRTAEMAAAGALHDATAIELCAIDSSTAADYLARVQFDPPPDSWRMLIERIRSSPGGPLADALNSPLALTLIRDTYRGGDDVRELLDYCDAIQRRFSGRQATANIIGHLLDRMLPSAYIRRPGQPPPRYDISIAHNALMRIATRLNQEGTRDLQWWHIPTWTSRTQLVMATGLTAGLIAGLVIGFGGSLVFGVQSGLILGLAFGLVVGLAADLGIWRVLGSSRDEIYSASPRSPLAAWRRERVSGLKFGLVSGLTSALVAGLAASFIPGYAAGLIFVFGILFGLGVGAAIAVTCSRAWATSVASAQLASREHTPIRLMRFLEDAHSRGILRAIGPAYQFRHTQLQDRLASEQFVSARILDPN